MEKKTPLYETHAALGAKLAPFAGYLMPIRYTSDTAEHQCVRNNVGIFDVSHMGEFLFRGPKALELLQKISTNDVSAIPIGKAQYNCMTNLNAGVVDDLIIYRIEDELYLMVVNASNIQKDWNWIAENNKNIGADMKDLSEETALIALSGPKALQTISQLTNDNIGALDYYAHGKFTLAGIPNVMVATTGYTGERTFEIFVPNDKAVAVWQALMEAGAQFCIQPIGLGARDTLRLEMGYMLYGNDLNDKTTPLEAGLGWITKFKKGAFNGSDLLMKQKEAGLNQKLVAFTVAERGGIPRHGHSIAVDGNVVGEVTSGTFSPTLQKGIGMGYVAANLAEVGKEFDIMIRDKAFKATVVKPPFVTQTSLSTFKK
jgi:aminomethyltransferase